MRWEGEAERKGFIITPITTMGIGGCISWEKSRSYISEISQLRVRVLADCAPPPASHWEGQLQSTDFLTLLLCPTPGQRKPRGQIILQARDPESGSWPWGVVHRGGGVGIASECSAGTCQTPGGSHRHPTNKGYPHTACLPARA